MLELGKEMNNFLNDEISFEEITSSIPTMLSAYPARHFNIKGLHSTMSGDETTFLQILLMAQYWLETSCKNLIIGAGHIIKSPVDILAYSRRVETLPPISEGFSTFIIKKLSDIRESKTEILGYIPAIIPGSSANTFEEACKAADIDATFVDNIEICQLNLEEFSKQKNISKQNLGYMGEASGTLELIRMIKSDSKLSCLQFMDKDKLIASIFFVKEKDFLEKENKLCLPTEICFNAHRIETIANETKPETSNNDVIKSGIEKECLIYESMSTMVLEFLEHQKKLLQSLSKSQRNEYSEGNDFIRYSKIEKYFRDLYINPQNIVIDSTRFNHAAKQCEGKLVIDEKHYYFFDHELDHVPGFLIMEGILQLVKMHLMYRLDIKNIDEYYFSSLKIKFSKFCEKDPSIRIRVNEVTSNTNEFNLMAEVIQQGNVICSADIGVRKINSKFVSQSAENGNASFANQKYVHKIDKRNIVVENLKVDAKTEKSTCKSIIPPKDHILYDGNAKAASILYLLEVTRQLLAQVSHTFGVPFDMQQILLYMDISVKEPLDKETTFYIECEKQKVIRLNDTLLSNLKTTIICNNMVTGEINYKAQAVSKDVYNKIRWKN